MDWRRGTGGWIGEDGWSADDDGRQRQRQGPVISHGSQSHLNCSRHTLSLTEVGAASPPPGTGAVSPASSASQTCTHGPNQSNFTVHGPATRPAAPCVRQQRKGRGGNVRAIPEPKGRGDQKPVKLTW